MTVVLQVEPGEHIFCSRINASRIAITSNVNVKIDHTASKRTVTPKLARRWLVSSCLDNYIRRAGRLFKEEVKETAAQVGLVL